MSGHVLTAVAPVELGELLTTALSTHPGLRPRLGVQLERHLAELLLHTRSRVHSDKLPWQHDGDWIERLVDDEFSGVVTRSAPSPSLWRVHETSRLSQIARLMGGAKIAALIVDGRHGLAAATAAIDPEAAAVRAAKRWERDAATIAALPDNLAVCTGAGRHPGAILEMLGLADHGPTVAALAMLDAIPPPAAPPHLEAAFCSWPPALALLRSMHPAIVHRPSRHPAALAAQSARSGIHRSRPCRTFTRRGSPRRGTGRTRSGRTR